MANYKARTTAPSTNNKNFIHTSAGGYNRCIEIKNGSCLPNCVGYAWGRWREILGKDPKLSRGNAEDWYGNTADGYERGKTPKLGAVICWKQGKTGKGSDGYGHVAIVEEIKANGDIVTSESAYGGERWRTKTYKKANGYNFGTFVFQGFIYLPIEFDEDKSDTGYETGDYRVTANLLNVRTGPGTNYARKNFKQYTENAQEQIRGLVGYNASGYPRGVEFTAIEVKGNWARTPSGWVCLDYCVKI